MRIKITGIKKNGNIEVAYTEVNKYNSKQTLSVHFPFYRNRL